MDEYFALNVIFVIIITVFLTKMYYMVEKMVTVMEKEFAQPNDHFSAPNYSNNLDFTTSQINKPPPPPPIPAEWLEENKEWMGID